jgi:hypothetical protein
VSATIRKAIDDALDKLEPDAVLAIAYLADRLLMGQRYYGKIDIATDPRDWNNERRDEIGDLLVYSAFAELKRTLAAAGEHPTRDTSPQKCTTASCQKIATRGRLCEGCAKVYAGKTSPEPAAFVPEAPTRSSVSMRGPVTFGCSCEPRELRSEKGLRCANCGTLVRLG